MKIRRSYAYMLVVLFIFLVGCNEDSTEKLSKSDYGEITEQDDYQLIIEQDKYAEDVDLIPFEIVNNSDTDITFGVEYAVEKYIDGEWYQIPFKDGTDFQEFGVIVKSNESYSQNVSVNQLGEDLSQGKYRIVKRISDDIILSAEFEVE